MKRHSGDNISNNKSELHVQFGKEKGIGPPSQGASLIAQLVKNLPAMQETPVLYLSWENPMEKGEATRSSVLGLPW